MIIFIKQSALVIALYAITFIFAENFNNGLHYHLLEGLSGYQFEKSVLEDTKGTHSIFQCMLICYLNTLCASVTYNVNSHNCRTYLERFCSVESGIDTISKGTVYYSKGLNSGSVGKYMSTENTLFID